MTEQEFRELSAAAALGALDPDQEREFEAALREHPDWSAHVETDRAVAARLADTIPEIAPPPALRESLLAQIATTAQDGSTDAAVRSDQGAAADEPSNPAPPAAQTTPDRRASAPSAGRRRWFALAASLAVLLAIGAGAFAWVGSLGRTPAVVALEQIDEATDGQSAQTTLPDGGTATLHWSESVGEAVLVSDGLPELADDQTYELWFVRDGEPIAAGVFEASAGGSATALLEGGMVPGDVIAVTVEPDGGAPGGVPTGDPILAIPTA